MGATYSRLVRHTAHTTNEGVLASSSSSSGSVSTASDSSISYFLCRLHSPLHRLQLQG